MSDINVIIYADGSSAMTPVSGQGQAVLLEEIRFDPQQTEFYLPPNLAHFESLGLKVSITDERT